jgi:hypothetical protein
MFAEVLGGFTRSPTSKIAAVLLLKMLVLVLLLVVLLAVLMLVVPLLSPLPWLLLVLVKLLLLPLLLMLVRLMVPSAEFTILYCCAVDSIGTTMVRAGRNAMSRS